MARIIIAGDLFPVPTNFTRFSKGDVENLFGKEIINIFKDADYRICNLEGALTDNPGYCEKTGPVLYAPTSTIAAYKKLGIDCCTLANNHITDAGPVGVFDTIKSLEDAGVKHVGAGLDAKNIQTHIFFKAGNKNICLYNVAETMYNAPTENSPGAHLYDEYLVCKELELLKKKCDYIIVVYHGGSEKFRYPSPQTRTRFHRMADSGADIILSQHTHCVGCEEYYNGAYLLYGQGDFLFRSFNNEYTDTGLLLEIDFESKLTVTKHIVRADTDTVRYDEKQDFSEFNNRSYMLSDTEKLQKLFDEYCLGELIRYLEAFKGGRFTLYRILRRLSYKIYRKLLLKSGYTRKQMLFSLHTLRSEQNREIAINGIKSYLKLTSDKSQ